MKLELFGKLVIITSRKKKNGEKCIKNLYKPTINYIYKQILEGITEGAILAKHKSVIGWWKVGKVSKNPLLN